MCLGVWCVGLFFELIMMEDSKIDVMQERIALFNQVVMSQDISNLPVGLFEGKIGLCIYFYHQARLNQVKEFEFFADKLLDDVCGQICTLGDKNISIESGLAGIGLGIIYLIKSGFIDGDENEILKELDDRVFCDFSSFIVVSGCVDDVADLKFVIGIIFYFLVRLENEKLDCEQRVLFESIVIKAINEIESRPSERRYIEPSLFSLNKYVLPIYLFVLQRLYRLDIYNYKLDRIFRELVDIVMSSFPLLKSNRLSLCFGLNEVRDGQMPDCLSHKKMLIDTVDVCDLINSEFRNRNIYFNNGLAGAYFLEKKLRGMDHFKAQLFGEKIFLSEVWDQYLNNSEGLKGYMGLATGFCGVILVYQDILKYIGNED